MSAIPGTTLPSTHWIGYDWDPRWCKDPEDLQRPCSKGHVNRGVNPRDASLQCATCYPKFDPICPKHGPKVRSEAGYRCGKCRIKSVQSRER